MKSLPPQTVAGGGLAPTTYPAAVPAPGRVIIDGKGFGHGVGMAQDGAYWMGKQGKTATQILKHFYPETALSKRSGSVRVPFGSANVVQVILPQGGTLGGRTIPAGGYVRLVANGGVVSANIGKAAPTSTTPDSVPDVVAIDGGIGRFSVEPGAIPVIPTTTSPSPSTSVEATPSSSPDAIPSETSTLPTEPANPSTNQLPADASTIPTLPGEASSTIDPANTTMELTIPVDETESDSASGSITAGTIRVTAGKGGVVIYGGKKFRGSFDFIAASTGMRVVNELDVEQYLRGMGEMRDPRWPAATLQSQAIAARTYALRMMGTRGEVCPTQSCQVYFGVLAEYPQMDAAVIATAGKVVTYKGELANTFYSASGGGTMAEPSEVFGPSKPIAYLQAGTYYTGDPKAWRVELSIAELGRRLGYPGVLYDVFVSVVGKSGRAVEVTLNGAAGPRRIFGPKFDAALGLRSNNFKLYVGRSSSQMTVPIDPNAPILELDFADASSGSPMDYQADLQGRDSALTTSVGATVVEPLPTITTSPVTTSPVITAPTQSPVDEVSKAAIDVPKPFLPQPSSPRWPPLVAGGVTVTIGVLGVRRILQSRSRAKHGG